MRIRYSYREPAVVVHVSGEVTPDTIPALHRAMESILNSATSPGSIVLDLLQVTLLSEACADALATYQERAGTLRVVATDHPVLGPLTRAGLDRILSIHPTVGTATWSCPAAVVHRPTGRGTPADRGVSPVPNRERRPGFSDRRRPQPRSLWIESVTRGDVVIVVPFGVLDLASYAQLRTTLVKFALEAPQAIIIDIGHLLLPMDAPLVVFTSVWMEVSDWPGVPLHLVTGDEAQATRLRRNGISRFVPVHRAIDDATAQLGQAPPRQRAVFTIPRGAGDAKVRRHVELTCHRWSCADDVVSNVVKIAIALADNAARHNPGEARLRLELGGGKLTVAVYADTAIGTPVNNARHADTQPDLTNIHTLADVWGCAPTLTGGNVLWATVRNPPR